MRYICLFVLLLAACSAPVKPGSALFTQDSGFIRKKDVLNILKYNHLTDTTASGWTLYPDTDTFGKYYRQPDGNIMACLLDVGGPSFETHLLMEVRPDDSLISAERFFHGNYPCCWENFDGFGKFRDYYYLKICNTGTAFCMSSICVFKNVQPQDSMSPIIQGYWSGSMGGEARDLTSQWTINGDSLLMHYQLEEYYCMDTLKRSIKTATFSIIFLKRENRWQPTDSALLEKIYGL